ncbi:ABC-1 domain protein [Phycicoccus elongatus Lp2]|uniref:ABC-1 domain protein n=1 Tax=Phycicoccus elongatus Lp2 TaxID=1193181 RepID=N0E1M9_9MICO|nr:AarF/UbiB family protein [Phycicoccus elongatus]CCH70873.1 ABC-1 domain protein [Phycicoccus elongatus Lp2]
MKLPTASHAGRYAALARLLVRYGRSDLVAEAGLDEFAAQSGESAVEGVDGPTGDARAEQFARDLESMGPTYIKLGQLLSTRFDLLPDSYTTALARLQDDVEAIPFKGVKETIEAEFGMALRHLFVEFDEQPLASASLGQVHRATLPSGREVVVKVQRAEARDVIKGDMEMLAGLAEMADKRTDLGRRYGFSSLLGQFRRSLVAELDYRREARNLLTFRDLTKDYDLLVVPDPVMDLTTARVLTMERIEGKKVTDVGPLGLMDIDARPIVEQLFRAYLRMILDDGVLHADPHPGNLILTDDGRLALIDLGMVAHVPPRMQDKVVKLLLAISDGDGEEAALVLAGMGHPLDSYDAASFRADVSHLVSEAASAGPDVQAGTVLVELSRLSGVHGLRPPAEMSMIGKALLNLDQATMHLDPTFSPTDALRDNVSEILTSGLKVSPGGVVAAAIEMKEFTSQLPRRANRIMDTLAEGDFRVRVHALDETRLHTVLQRVANRITLGLIIAATILGAALMMRVPSTAQLFGYPAIAMVLFLFAVVAGGALAAWIVLTDRKVARSTDDPTVDQLRSGR